MAVVWPSNVAAQIPQQQQVTAEKEREAAQALANASQQIQSQQQSAVQQVVNPGDVMPGFGPSRYIICGSEFYLDNKYQPVKCLGAGAYGIVW